MELSEAIQRRQSIRAFKPDPAPRTVLREILELAVRAPSWGNTQPWEFVVAAGEKLSEIKEAYLANDSCQPSSDLPAPAGFEQPYDTRYRTVGRKMFEIRGISREDRDKRRQWVRSGIGLFGAPAVIYILTSRTQCFQGGTLSAWPIFDCGAVANNIMLLAADRGLGATAQIQAVQYPDILRARLDIPESKLIVMGVAIGYPDWSDPINQYRTPREPVDSITKWCGFD